MIILSKTYIPSSHTISRLRLTVQSVQNQALRLYTARIITRQTFEKSLIHLLQQFVGTQAVKLNLIELTISENTLETCNCRTREPAGQGLHIDFEKEYLYVFSFFEEKKLAN